MAITDTLMVPEALHGACQAAARRAGTTITTWVSAAADAWADDPFVGYAGTDRLPHMTRLEIELMATDPDPTRVQVWLALAASEGWGLESVYAALRSDRYPPEALQRHLRRGRALLAQPGPDLLDVLSRIPPLPFPEDLDRPEHADTLATIAWTQTSWTAFTDKAARIGWTRDRALRQALSDRLWREHLPGATDEPSHEDIVSLQSVLV